MTIITYQEFERVDLRSGVIIKNGNILLASTDPNVPNGKKLH